MGSETRSDSTGKFGARKGQTLVLFAVAVTVVFAMLAVAIDAGFLWGQKRFMQNGADSGALGAATLLATNVAQYKSGEIPAGSPVDVYFLVTDQEVRSIVQQYVDKNQNPGLATRTLTSTYELAYFVTIDGNYNGDLNDLVHNEWVTSPTGADPRYQGRVPDGTYRVRVTPRTTIQNLFAGIIGQGEDDVRATAVAGIYGYDQPAGGPGRLWPLTAWDHVPIGSDPDWDYFADPVNRMEPLPLWDPQAEYRPEGTKVPLDPYKNVLDLSPTTEWPAPDPTYRFPAPPEGVTSNGPQGWDRHGFVPDPEYSGNLDKPNDTAYWVAHFFGGEVMKDNQFPVYADLDGIDAGANLGQNIDRGLYGVHVYKHYPNDWPTYEPDPELVVGGNTEEGCFFCDADQLALDAQRSGTPADPKWGRYRVALIALWGQPENWDKLTGDWTVIDDKHDPSTVDRVRITRFHAFKIFEAYKDGNSPPNSGAFGLWTSALLPPGEGGGPPSSWFNSVRLVE